MSLTNKLSYLATVQCVFANMTVSAFSFLLV